MKKGTFLTLTVLLGGLLAFLSFPSSAQHRSSAWRQTSGSGFSAADPVDSLTSEGNVYVLGRVVGDTIIVGPCADNPSWDPFNVGAPITPCGRIYMSEDAGDIDTLYIGTGWSGGSFLNGHHVIIGGDGDHDHNDIWSPFIHMETRGDNMGLGVRDPTRELEIGAGEVTINHQAEATNNIDYDVELLTSVGANADAGFWDVLYGDSYSGSKELYRHMVRAGASSPNSSAMAVWYIKNEHSDALTEVFWVDDEGHLIVNGKDEDGSAHPNNRAFSAFVVANRADSSFEVNGGMELNGGLAMTGNSEVQGMFSVGDSPAWANDIDVSSGTTFSRMDAGDNQFTVSSRTELKDIQDTLDTALAREVLDVLRDSVQVQRWTFKPEALRSSKTVQSIWSDTARVAERVQEHVERREKVVVDSTQTVEARQVATGDSIVTRHDTTWTPVYYKVSAEERTGLQDSLLAESLDRVQSQLAAYEAAVQAKAQKQHVGMVAEDAVRLSRLVAPEAAEPGVVNGNHVQAALVLAARELYRQGQAAFAFEDRVDSLGVELEATQEQVDNLQTWVIALAALNGVTLILARGKKGKDVLKEDTNDA